MGQIIYRDYIVFRTERFPVVQPQASNQALFADAPTSFSLEAAAHSVCLVHRDCVQTLQFSLLPFRLLLLVSGISSVKWLRLWFLSGTFFSEEKLLFDSN